MTVDKRLGAEGLCQQRGSCQQQSVQVVAAIENRDPRERSSRSPCSIAGRLVEPCCREWVGGHDLERQLLRGVDMLTRRRPLVPRAWLRNGVFRRWLLAEQARLALTEVVEPPAQRRGQRIGVMLAQRPAADRRALL